MPHGTNILEISQRSNICPANAKIPKIIHHFWLTKKSIDVVEAPIPFKSTSYKELLITQAEVLHDFEHRFYALNPDSIPHTIKFVAKDLNMTVIHVSSLVTSYPKLFHRIEECNTETSDITNLVDSFKKALLGLYGGFVIDLNYRAITHIPEEVLSKYKYIAGHDEENYLLGSIPNFTPIQDMLETVENTWNDTQWSEGEKFYDLQQAGLASWKKAHQQDIHFLSTMSSERTFPKCNNIAVDVMKLQESSIIIGCDGRHMSYLSHELG